MVAETDVLEANLHNLEREVERIERKVDRWTTSNCFQLKESCVARVTTCERRFTEVKQSVKDEATAREKEVRPLKYLLIAMLLVILTGGVKAYMGML